jgi:hypothetical protein
MLFPADSVPFEKWYAFKGEFPPGSSVSHRIIIVYKQANCTKYFYVTSYESKEEKEKINRVNRDDIKSVADFVKSEWKDVNNKDILSKDSCVQCNKRHIHAADVSCLKEQYANGKIEYLGVVPRNIQEKIIYATCLSDSFTQTEKKLYTED